MEFIDDDIQFINNGFDSFRKYFNAVYKHVYESSTLPTLLHSGRIDIETYQYRLTKYDQDRNLAHNRAIDSCNQINRMCELHGIEQLCPVPVFEGDKCIDRGDIADFIGRYVYEVFQQDRNGQELAPIDITNEIKYGTKSEIDVAIEITENNNRNPECAYKQEDVYEEAYEDFEGFEPCE